MSKNDSTISNEERREVAATMRAISASDYKIDRPTCKTIEHGRPDEYHVCKSCSRCSYGWFEDIYDKPYSYCPNCGAEVVSDAS